MQLDPHMSHLDLNDKIKDVEENGADDDGDDYQTALEATDLSWWIYGVVSNSVTPKHMEDILKIIKIIVPFTMAQPIKTNPNCSHRTTSQHTSFFPVASSMLFFNIIINPEGYLYILGPLFCKRLLCLITATTSTLTCRIIIFTTPFYIRPFVHHVSGFGLRYSISLHTTVPRFQPFFHVWTILRQLASYLKIKLFNVLLSGLALAIIPISMNFGNDNFSFNSWRLFLIFCAVPSLVIAIVLFWYPESPMFLLKKGRNVESLEILKNVYAKNTGRRHSTFPITYLKCLDHKSSASSSSSLSWWSSLKHIAKETWRQTNALFGRALLRTTTIMLIVNFTIQFGYYGLWLWFPELFNRLEQYHKEHPDDKVSICELTSYQNNNETEAVVDLCSNINENPLDTTAIVNSLIIAVAPLPFNVWTIFYIDRLGRKFFLVFSMVLSGLSAFGIYLVKSSLDNLILACVFGAVSTMGFNALDCLGVELFPTHLRSTALAVTLLFARLGSISGQLLFGLLLDVYCWVPITMVAILLIGGGLLSIILPNTTRTALE
ncbi:unnamed protein product, partial [Meganyctiphanes norvegica]